MLFRPLSFPYVVMLIPVLCLPALDPLIANGNETVAEKRSPAIKSVKISNPPAIDGDLGDDCWKQASRLTGFIFSDVHRPATEETIAYLGYDSSKLYVAFHARDSKPHSIRAEQIKKDGSHLNDDLVEITLDTYHTHKDVYFFDVNPLGTRFESIPRGAAAKNEWRGDWEAAARIVDDGWTAEMAIPFSLFRYEPRETVWSVQFSRYLSREREWSNYPDIGSPQNFNLMADWTDLDLPVVKHKPLVLAYGLTSFSDSKTFTGGIDLKQVTPGGLTGLLTLNPDFKNIEQGIANADFSYTEKFVSDNRAFFSEGSGFLPSNTYLYTRRIEDIDAGLKGFGQVGRLSAGLMDVEAKNGDRDSATKVNYDLNPYSSISALGVFQETGVNNAAFGSTLNIGRPCGLSGREFISFGRYHTQSQDSSGDGDYLSASYSRNPDQGKLGFYLSYLDVTPGFSPKLGYYPEPDRVGWYSSLSFNQRLDHNAIRSFYWYGSAYRYLNQQGGLRYGGASFFGSVSFRNNTGVGCDLLYEERPPNIDQTGSLSGSWKTNDPFRTGGLFFRFGKLDGADYFYTTLSQRARVSSKLYGSVSLERIRMAFPADLDANTQLILSSTYDLDGERSLGLRWIKSNTLSNLYLSFRKIAVKGTDYYLILGDPNAEKTQDRITFKAVVPVRF